MAKPEPGQFDLSKRACVHQGERCWPCTTGGCYDEPTEHPWWDSDDVEAAASAGQPAPAGMCGCAFCGWPALGRKNAFDTPGGD